MTPMTANERKGAQAPSETEAIRSGSLGEPPSKGGVSIRLRSFAVIRVICAKSEVWSGGGDASARSHFGEIIFSGRTISSNFSPVRSPSSMTTSRRFFPSLWAFLATLAALS